MSEPLHFTVTSEFVTRISRNLWAEGACAKALRLLVKGLHGMTEGLALRIVTGHAKLIGENSTIRMVRDNTKRDDRGLKLPQSMSAAFKLKERALTRAERETQSIARAASRRFDNIEEAILQDAAKLSYKQSIEDRISSHWDRVGKALGVLPEHKEKPRPVKNFANTSNGWLSPDGEFYRCGYLGHISLAQDLGSNEPDLEKKRWLKLQNDAWLLSWRIESGERKITQSQLDAVFQWSQEKGKPMPEFET